MTKAHQCLCSSKKVQKEKKEDKDRKDLGEGRKSKKIEVTSSKIIHAYINIYVRHLKDSNTKLPPELNAGLEKLNFLALCINTFIYKYIIIC